MMKQNIEKLLAKMNEMQHNADRLVDKSWEEYQAGNTKKSDRLDKQAEIIGHKIDGIHTALTMLGLNVWKNGPDGEWLIPEDDITRAC